MLETRLNDLKRELIGYAGFVEQMVDRSVRGLLAGDRNLLRQVRNDELRANEWEVGIDALCAHVIAQFQPMARDLRTILMALGMNKDLERMADHAVNIAEDALFLIERPQVKPFVDIPRMAEAVRGMMRDCLLAFINEDVRLAKAVCERDAVVDDLHDKVVRELINYMTTDPSTVERSVRLLNVARNLERIADL
jgi:phosphate transport system protein